MIRDRIDLVDSLSPDVTESEEPLFTARTADRILRLLPTVPDKLDAGVTRLTIFQSKLSAITPPPDIRSLHAALAKDTAEELAALRSLASAIRKLGQHPSLEDLWRALNSASFPAWDRSAPLPDGVGLEPAVRAAKRGETYSHVPALPDAANAIFLVCACTAFAALPLGAFVALIAWFAECQSLADPSDGPAWSSSRKLIWTAGTGLLLALAPLATGCLGALAAGIVHSTIDYHAPSLRGLATSVILSLHLLVGLIGGRYDFIDSSFYNSRRLCAVLVILAILGYFLGFVSTYSSPSSFIPWEHAFYEFLG